MTIVFDGQTVALAGGPGNFQQFETPWVDVDDNPVMDDFEALFEAGRELARLRGKD